MADKPPVNKSMSDFLHPIAGMEEHDAVVVPGQETIKPNGHC